MVLILRRAVRALVWSGAGLLVAAFLVGYAALYLPPTHFWWADLIAVVLPVLGVGVGLLGVGLVGHGAYRRTWRQSAVGAVLLLLVAMRFGAVPTGNASGGDTEALRLMTFNLPPAFAHEPDRERVLTELVRREAPTVLAFQETQMRAGTFSGGSPAFADGPLRVLLRDAMGYTPPRVRPPETPVHRPVLGQIRLDSMSVHPLPPSGDTNPRARYTRTYFAWQGRPAVLYNVHLHTVGARP